MIKPPTRLWSYPERRFLNEHFRAGTSAESVIALYQTKFGAVLTGDDLYQQHQAYKRAKVQQVVLGTAPKKRLL